MLQVIDRYDQILVMDIELKRLREENAELQIRKLVNMRLRNGIVHASDHTSRVLKNIWLLEPIYGDSYSKRGLSLLIMMLKEL